MTTYSPSIELGKSSSGYVIISNETSFNTWQFNGTSYTYNVTNKALGFTFYATTASNDCYAVGYYGTATELGSVSIGLTTVLNHNFTRYTDSLTVYKNFKATLSYDAAGGSDAPTSQTSTKKSSSDISGNTVSFTISSTAPVRTGYTFDGWSTTEGGSAEYQPGETIAVAYDTTVTLYAVWTALYFTLSYDANNGTGAPNSETLQAGTAATLSTTVPSRAGYKFLGWGGTASDSSPSYQAGGSISIVQDTTLYALWTKTVTLSYDAQGGTGAPSDDTGSTSTTTATEYATIVGDAPTRSGYVFIGWSSEKP